MSDVPVSSATNESEPPRPSRSREPRGSVRQSPSVIGVVTKLGSEAVDAATVTRAILKEHPEYGRGSGESVGRHLQPTGRKRTAHEWLGEVEALLGPDAQVLHGRLLLLGLAEVEPSVRRQLIEHGFLQSVVEELHEPLERVLPGARPRAGGTPDPLPFHSDNPARRDELDRRMFAGYLAAKLRYLREQATGSFLVHLDGPWGTGKTTLLNLLQYELEEPQETPDDRRAGSSTSGPGDPAQQDRGERDALTRRWAVVQFNAWQAQRFSPPWWAFLQVVSRQLPGALWRTRRRRRAVEVWLVDTLVRVWMALGTTLLAVVVLSLLVWLVFGALQFQLLGVTNEALREVSAIVALAGVAFAAAKRLVPGSSAAELFITSSRDPMASATRHFRRLSRLAYPVAVFVDDLDRCKPSYVVELLEGVQTLFRDADIAYVVASDRRWIEASYQKEYADLAASVGEPGRTLGYLFLQKAFQVSARLPAMHDRVASRYWRTLLDPTDTEERDQDLAELRGRYRAFSSPDEISQSLAHASRARPGVYAIEAQAALEALASPRLQRETETSLLRLGPLLERNPRSMKRLINAYDVEQAALIAQSTIPDLPDFTLELGLWTLVRLRWPALAEFLQANPPAVNIIHGHADASELLPDDEHVRKLLVDAEVRRVVTGEQVGARLSERMIRATSGREDAEELKPAVA